LGANVKVFDSKSELNFKTFISNWSCFQKWCVVMYTPIWVYSRLCYWLWKGGFLLLEGLPQLEPLVLDKDLFASKPMIQAHHKAPLILHWKVSFVKLSLRYETFGREYQPVFKAILTFESWCRSIFEKLTKIKNIPWRNRSDHARFFLSE
jgi:hypothetical protein